MVIKYKVGILKITIFSLILCVLIYFLIFEEFLANKYFNIKIFIEKKNIIIEYCNLFGINPRKFVSVIFGELYNNLDYDDEFDKLKADLGLDPSIGFSQIRVSTFAWIEDNYADGFYIRKSKDRDEMIQKLISDSTNILYSIYYMKLISDKFIMKYKFEPSVKTLASYYGYGIDYYRTEIDSSYYNQIGITAEKFYHSNKLIKEFPK